MQERLKLQRHEEQCLKLYKEQQTHHPDWRFYQKQNLLDTAFVDKLRSAAKHPKGNAGVPIP